MYIISAFILTILLELKWVKWRYAHTRAMAMELSIPKKNWNQIKWKQQNERIKSTSISKTIHGNCFDDNLEIIYGLTINTIHEWYGLAWNGMEWWPIVHIVSTIDYRHNNLIIKWDRKLWYFIIRALIIQIS